MLWGVDQQPPPPSLSRQECVTNDTKAFFAGGKEVGKRHLMVERV